MTAWSTVCLRRDPKAATRVALLHIELDQLDQTANSVQLQSAEAAKPVSPGGTLTSCAYSRVPYRPGHRCFFFRERC